MPERVHGQCSAVVCDQEVGSGGKDGGKQAHGEPVGQKRAGPSSWAGEAFHEREGSVGQGQAVVEMVGGVQGRRQPVA